MKRTLALLLAVLMMFGLVACTGEKPVEEDPAPATSNTEVEPVVVEKQVINLWAFTDEVPKMVNYYVSQNPDFAEKYEVKTTVVATDGGAYQQALDQALAGGGEDAPDMYCAEAAFIVKYAQGDASQYAAPYADLGMGDVDAQIKEGEIASYTVDIATRPSDNELVALGYQATGGAFIYRASIAEEVFGASDAATVEAAIGAGTGNWEKFWEAAATLKAAGYPITSGDGDVWHAVENSSEKGWIVDGKLNIDEKRMEFFEISKMMKENGWHNDSRDWQDAWFADMSGASEANAFGFFGPAWLVNYTIQPNCGGAAAGEGTYGDWRVCAPPVGFFWGGTWLLANNDSDVKEGVGEIIQWITLDSSKDGLQYAWANGTVDWDNDPSTPTGKDAVASGAVMAESNGELDFLGGQDMFPAFIAGNAYANGKCLTQYDENINTWFRDQVTLYANGEKDLETAIADFKQQVADNLDVVVE